MFRQEDSRRLYPDIDLSPLTPVKTKSDRNIMGRKENERIPRHRRSYSSGLSLDYDGFSCNSDPTAEDCLPHQPTRRGTMARRPPEERSAKKLRHRSFSSGMCLTEASNITPLPTAPIRQRSRDDASEFEGWMESRGLANADRRRIAEDWQARRENSERSLRCLPMAAVPRRPSVVEKEEMEQQQQRQDRRARRRSQDRGDEERRRRHKSVDDMRYRMREEEEEFLGRRVIRSTRDEDEFSRRLPQRESGQGRRGRSREPATSRREQGIPKNIKLVRGQSCGGRIPCSIAIEPLSQEHHEEDFRRRNTSFEHSTGEHTTDDESTSSSSMDDDIDDFDEASLGLMFGGSVHADKDICNQTQVSTLTNDMCWQNTDGSVRSTSSPENREALQRTISAAMSSLTAPTGTGPRSLPVSSNSSTQVRASNMLKNQQELYEMQKRQEEQQRKQELLRLQEEQEKKEKQLQLQEEQQRQQQLLLEQQKKQLEEQQEKATLQLKLMQQQQQQQQEPTSLLKMQEHHHQQEFLRMQLQQQEEQAQRSSLLSMQEQQNQQLFLQMQQQQQLLHMQQQQQQTPSLDDSKRTQPTVRMDCNGSVYSTVSAASQVHGNMLRPWACACGEDNEAGFMFCGMCGDPERWTCPSCNFNRNKSRSPHCGGCGIRREGAPTVVETRRGSMLSTTSGISMAYNGGGIPTHRSSIINPYGMAVGVGVPMGNNSIRSQHSSLMQPGQGVPMGNSSVRSQRSAAAMSAYSNPIVS